MEAHTVIAIVVAVVVSTVVGRFYHKHKGGDKDA